MSKAQEIRDALAGGSMTFAELRGKLGGEVVKLRKAVSNLQQNGFVTVMGRGDEGSIALAKGGARKASGKKPKKKRSAKKAAGGGLKRYRDIKVTLDEGRILAAAQREACRKHAQTTFSALESVLDLDEAEEMVSIAFRSHKEALALLAG